MKLGHGDASGRDSEACGRPGHRPGCRLCRAFTWRRGASGWRRRPCVHFWPNVRGPLVQSETPAGRRGEMRGADVHPGVAGASACTSDSYHSANAQGVCRARVGTLPRIFTAVLRLPHCAEQAVEAPRAEGTLRRVNAFDAVLGAAEGCVVSCPRKQLNPWWIRWPGPVRRGRQSPGPAFRFAGRKKALPKASWI